MVVNLEKGNDTAMKYSANIKGGSRTAATSKMEPFMIIVNSF